MTYEEFELKVKRFEELSKKHPKWYKFKVLLVTLLGYSYIFLVLAILIAMVVGLILVYIHIESGFSLIRRLVFPLIILAFLIVKSLFVKFEKPQGFYLNEHENLELNEVVKEISKKLKTKKIHQIILTDEMNASLYQYPRLGVFGFYQNFLILGIPLMATVSKAELESIIAHELGHLSGKHGQFGAYIFRLYKIWTNLLSNLENNQSKATIIFEKFLKFYIPFFNAYTFVLRREEEYFADQLAVEVTNEEVFSTALVKLGITTLHEERVFRNQINKYMIEQKEPIDTYFTEFFNSLKTRLSNNTVNAYLSELLSLETNVVDTHPALKDRITAINGTRQPHIVYQTSAFDTMISNKVTYISSLNRAWKDRVKNAWEKQHQHYLNAKNRLSELSNKNDLTTIEKLEKAEITELLEDQANALPLYQDVLKDDIHNKRAKFAIGRIQLENNDPEGVSILEDIMKQDYRFTGEGCSSIYHYLMRNGKVNEAKDYLNRAITFNQELELAKAERESIRKSDTLIEHQLNEEDIKSLINQLERFDHIDQIYLVKKAVSYMKEFPLFALGIQFTGINLEVQRAIVGKMANELDLPGEFFIIPLHQDNEKMYPTLKTIPTARIK